jgi:hypothetical protein
MTWWWWLPVIFAFGVIIGGLYVNRWWWLLGGALVWGVLVASIVAALAYATRNPWPGDDQ